MEHWITVLPGKRNIPAKAGETLLDALRRHGLAPDAPCGGTGKCGKCTVLIGGQPVLACRTVICRDLTVTLPQKAAPQVLAQGIKTHTAPGQEGYLLCVDIGTTTVACCLLDGGTGVELAQASAANPQRAFGADVVSRIRAALGGQQDVLTQSIRDCLTCLTEQVCQKAAVYPEEIRVVSIVANTCMQQLFLGIRPKNLSQIPFTPVLTEAKAVPAAPYLPLFQNAQLLIVPDISGFVGADTVGCLLATRLYEAEETTLLVDIGTNGEMVLGDREKLVCCAAAAGPALEGANISCGMPAAPGAIDRVWLEKGKLCCHVIGDVPATGICGSGLIDAVAAALDGGLLNRRGRILDPAERNGQRFLPLTDTLSLTQEDIRQVQLAKGAIAAGIELMAAELDIPLRKIGRVLLAGAFGSYLNPESACRIGLIPAVLAGKAQPIGNAALSGAKCLACDPRLLETAQTLARQVRPLNLAQLPEFSKCFARNTGF